LRVLVFDGNARSSLAVTRSLGRAGAPVTVAAPTRRSLAGVSRFASARMLLPDPEENPDRYEEALREEALRWEGALWLPMTDASLTVVSGARDDLSGVILPFPGREALDLAWDKGRLLGRAAEAGVLSPATHSPESADEVRDLAPRLTYPVVLKPRFTCFRDAAGFRRGTVSYVRDAKALPGAWEEENGRVPRPLIQERIAGHGMGVFVLADRGKVVARFAHRRLREKPPTGGVSVLRESIPFPDLLRRPVDRLMEALEWFGVAMVEFRVDARDGKPYLMEINPRFWGSLQLAIDAGVDFPLLLYRLVQGERVAPTEKYRIGVRCRWLLGDLDHLWIRMSRSHRPSELPPSLPGRPRALLDFLDPFAGKMEVMRPSDPIPGFYEIGAYLCALLSRRP